VNEEALAHWGLLRQKKRNVCHLPGGSEEMHEKSHIRQPALGRDLKSGPSEHGTEILFTPLQHTVQHLHTANITTICRAI
jgi:hypothetical protein